MVPCASNKIIDHQWIRAYTCDLFTKFETRLQKEEIGNNTYSMVTKNSEECILISYKYYCRDSVVRPLISFLHYSSEVVIKFR